MPHGLFGGMIKGLILSVNKQNSANFVVDLSVKFSAYKIAVEWFSLSEYTKIGWGFARTSPRELTAFHHLVSMGQLRGRKEIEGRDGGLGTGAEAGRSRKGGGRGKGTEPGSGLFRFTITSAPDPLFWGLSQWGKWLGGAKGFAHGPCWSTPSQKLLVRTAS